MKNHEWNPITTAPKDKPILVTDGESVWFGRISAAAAVFDGANLQDGSSIWMDLDDLTGWLPAPDTMWEPQKTGEEMFRDLGYEPWSEKNSFTFYNKRTGEWITVFDDYVAKGNRVKNMPGDYTKAEILACAQLIREMEAEENG